MTKKERYKLFIEYFKVHAPDAETELLYDNPFQLLVAVILSAQCTDKRVNLVTPALFERFPDAASMAEAGEEELFAYIKSISYPNNKTRHLLGMARRLTDVYQGIVPMKVEELLTLPGVGRKTANVITSVLDKQPNMAVDTHVFRVSERLGLTTRARNPLQAEKQLVAYIPESYIHKAHHWLILHGRYICLARKPNCAACGLNSWCKYYQQQLTKAPQNT